MHEATERKSRVFGRLMAWNERRLATRRRAVVQLPPLRSRRAAIAIKGDVAL